MTRGGPELAPGMTTIGFIGSGMIGSTVARLSVAADVDVAPDRADAAHTRHGA